MRASLPCFVVLCLTMAGCAGGGGGGGDAGQDDDAGTTRRDAGRDAGGGVCPMGQHRCGGGCIDDLENDPANGCRFGCGDPCPTPPDGTSSCDAAGLCAFDCPIPFHREGTECVCTPRTCDELGFTCGAPDDGCGSPLDCGSCGGDGVCVEGTCACTPDEHEPNDSVLAIMGSSVVTIPDVNDWTMTFDTWNLDDPSDVDWYRFVVQETGTTNPGFTITLDDIPPGSDYELTAYYVCDDGADISSCTIGSPCSGTASGTTSETINMDIDCDRFGWDDNGALFIRVTSARWGGSCAPYSLTVHSES